MKAMILQIHTQTLSTKLPYNTHSSAFLRPYSKLKLPHSSRLDSYPGVTLCVGRTHYSHGARRRCAFQEVVLLLQYIKNQYFFQIER